MTTTEAGVAPSVEARPERRTWRPSRRTVEAVMPFAVVIVLFALWEGAVALFAIPPFVLPAPSVIFEATWQWRAPILDNALQTLFTTAVGFALAIAFGLVTGVLIGSSSLIYNGFYPVLIGFNSIPKVAVVPILVIWFGIGTIPAIITAFLISFFPILVNVATGIATVEPELKDVLRALGASRRDIIMKVGIPRSLPYFFASLKIAITVAFVGSIIAETVRCQQRHRPPDDRRVLALRGAARLRRPPGDRGDGRDDVLGRDSGGAPHDRLGNAQHGEPALRKLTPALHRLRATRRRSGTYSPRPPSSFLW